MHDVAGIQTMFKEMNAKSAEAVSSMDRTINEVDLEKLFKTIKFTEFNSIMASQEGDTDPQLKKKLTEILAANKLTNQNDHITELTKQMQELQNQAAKLAKQ